MTVERMRPRGSIWSNGTRAPASATCGMMSNGKRAFACPEFFANELTMSPTATGGSVAASKMSASDEDRSGLFVRILISA